MKLGQSRGQARRAMVFGRMLLAAGVLAVAPAASYGLGGDHPRGQTVAKQDSWPAALADLVNHSSRVHGYFVNWSDWFQFAGDARTFNDVLTAYAKLPDIEHQLIVESGAGTAASPWAKSDKTASKMDPIACDWELHITNARPLQVTLKVWLGGKIKLEDLRIPENVTVNVTR